MSPYRWLSAFGVCLVLAAAATAAPMKALIVDGQNNHNWKETTPILQKLLEETGLFTVDVATTPQGKEMSGFKPDFAPYNVVVMNYTGDDWPEATKKALEKYMGDGGGLVIFHAASNAFPQWKEYNEMIGLGGWGGRSEKDGPYVYYKDGKLVRDTTPGPAGQHGPQHPFQIVVREKEHPITKGLPEKFTHSADELYSQLRGPAKNLTVLATAFADPAKGGTGRDEPMLMTLTWGKGRVFHTALGHAGEQLRSVAFIVTFQRGTQWAATGKVTQQVPADFLPADQPSIRTAAAMKALIVDGQNAHNWKETTPILKKLLEDTGLFSVDVATSPAKGQDMSSFKPEFAKCNLVVLNYQGDDWPEATQKAFVDYVANGGGVVCYHFACAAFPKWKEYNRIIGVGGWGDRDEKTGPYLCWRDGKIVRATDPPGKAGFHGPQQPFEVVIRDFEHPITKGLPKTMAHPADELYCRLRGPAENVAVLATAFAPKDKGGTDEHEPMLMTIAYGKGRVFHTALGHAGEHLKAPSFIVTFTRGAEWAATGKVTQKAAN